MDSNIYYLMNKDKVLAALQVGDNTASIVELYANLPGYIKDIHDWLEGRTSPVGRKNINELLKLANISSKQEYLMVTHGISLTDTFWVKRATKDNTNWENINPYKNRFSRIVSDIALNLNIRSGNFRSPSPDYSVGGSTNKCWKRINGKIYLYKTDGEMWSGPNGKNGIRPFCEYYANQVAQALISNTEHYVKYNIQVLTAPNGYMMPYVYSEAFTTEDSGFISYGDSKFKDMSIIELDKQLGNNYEARIKIREMIVLDSIILNCDRHIENYGFLVDNDTFQIKDIAPIFDQDCSLGYRESINQNNLKDAYINAMRLQPKTEIGGYIQQAKWALTKDIRNRLQMMYPFRFKRLPDGTKDISDLRIQFMELIVNTQIKRILQ